VTRGVAVVDRAEIPFETRQPFELQGELAARVDRLGLAPHVAQLRDEGWTVVPRIAPLDFTARLREVCIRLAEDTAGAGRGRSAALLLGRDAIFEEVVLNPCILALVEVMCGKGALLSQLIASIRPQGSPALGLHADQNWFPAPFPKHNQLFTMCWAMDEFSEAGGCTKVIPRSHEARRHPNREEVRSETGALPIECEAGSLACWDGSVWHGNYPRTLPGERVVLHITFSRLALRPVESYAHLGEDWLAGKDYALRVMLGREDMLGTTTIALGGTDYRRLPRTFTWART